MPEAAADDPLEELRRWRDFGGTWEVAHQDSRVVVVSLRRCDGGEEVHRVSLPPTDLESFLTDVRTSGD